MTPRRKARGAPPPRAHAAPAPRARRSLSHVGGAVETAGDPRAAELLRHALEVQPAPAPGKRRFRDGGTPDDVAPDDVDRAHVHGFHAYPARMHPVTAARLVGGFTEAGQTVLDPFCGSGTVLVEAMLAGRNAVGTDMNPLAVRLASLKTRPHGGEEIARMVAAAKEVAAFADARRKARAGATRRLDAEDVALFEPHVLLELAGLRAGIANLSPPAREDLQLVLSAVLVKVSRKRGDTSEHLAQRRLAGGHAARLFLQKTEELGRRLEAFAKALPEPPPTARVTLDDATRLETVRDASVDAAITSPPYVGTYDYVAHHALRFRWLGLDPRAFMQAELGARRRFASLDPREAFAAWSREVSAFLRATARALRPGRPLVVLMADSVAAREPLRADWLVSRLAAGTGYRFVARASQERPHFHLPTASAFQDRPRAEHAMLLERR